MLFSKLLNKYDKYLTTKYDDILTIEQYSQLVYDKYFNKYPIINPEFMFNVIKHNNEFYIHHIKLFELQLLPSTHLYSLEQRLLDFGLTHGTDFIIVNNDHKYYDEYSDIIKFNNIKDLYKQKEYEKNKLFLVRPYIESIINKFNNQYHNDYKSSKHFILTPRGFTYICMRSTYTNQYVDFYFNSGVIMNQYNHYIFEKNKNSKQGIAL